MKNKLIKSLLFIPGHKTVYLKKLKKTIADAFVVDLEDSVPVNKKHMFQKK